MNAAIHLHSCMSTSYHSTVHPLSILNPYDTLTYDSAPCSLTLWVVLLSVVHGRQNPHKQTSNVGPRSLPSTRARFRSLCVPCIEYMVHCAAKLAANKAHILEASLTLTA